MMIGDGTLMILLKVATGWEIKMLFTICAEKPHKLSLSSNLTECLSQEQNKARSIKELSVVNLSNTAKSKLIEPVQWQIELVMLCYIPCLVDLSLTIALSSLNTSLLT